MTESVRVCDCFPDEAIYCLSEDLLYADFFNLCLQRQKDRRNTFLIMNFFANNESVCFIAYCNDFIKDQDYIYIEWNSPTRTQCFYYATDDYEPVSCTDGVSLSINNFCLICQRDVLREPSNKLNLFVLSLFR